MPDFSLFAERERAGWADPSIVAAYVDRFGLSTAEQFQASWAE